MSDREGITVAAIPSHLALPASAWPRGRVYYFCPRHCIQTNGIRMG